MASMVACGHNLLHHDNEEGDEEMVGRGMIVPTSSVAKHDENQAPRSAHWTGLGGSCFWERVEGL
jgi:hypothetical protein